MKFKSTKNSNVAENRVKLSPKLQEELKREEEKEAAEEQVKEVVSTPDEVLDKRKLEKAAQTKNAEAIISVNLRMEPHLNADILCILYPGIKVSVTDSEDPDWYALVYQGRNVFVKKEFIKLV